MYEELSKGMTTGVEEVETTPNSSEVISTLIYDLNGRIIASENAASGIYIVKKTYQDGKICVEKTVVM